jgi:D-3-phosphoglycerate dehydrogenase / 2-oxoglutarate reductase
MKLTAVRFDFRINPIFDQMLQKHSDVLQKVCEQSNTDAVNLAHFQQAHIYHLSAARDEVPSQWQVDDALLDQCPNLICVSTSGVGYDTVNVDACNRRGILVLNQAGCNSDSVCEHTFGLILSLKHRIAESDRVLRAGATTNRENLMGREIKGLTLGIIGLGNIGRRVAATAKSFGMNAIAYDPHIQAEDFSDRQAKSVSFQELLAQSDIVSVHCPRTKETMNMFNEKAYTSMKSGAIFISTARGGIHDEAALLKALNDKKLSGAGLDVWAKEPPQKDNALLSLSNVISTYHTAGVTHEARYNSAAMGAEQIIAIAKGERPARIVNPQVLPEFDKRQKQLFDKDKK